MKLQIEELKNRLFVKVQGRRLDTFSVSIFKEELHFHIQSHGNKRIILDISCCSFCDASGLSAILSMHWMCYNAGGMLILTGIQANVMKLIKICNLELLLFLTEDVGEFKTI